MHMNRYKIYGAVVLLTWVSAANAYVDPGSSLLLMQGGLAIAGGILVFIKNPIETTKHWIRKIKARIRA
jgi:hypothetical protein